MNLNDVEIAAKKVIENEKFEEAVRLRVLVLKRKRWWHLPFKIVWRKE
jgi:hypothetical protein